MNRVYNFSAGPSAMPLEVLERCAKEMTCYGSSGMSVMEMSHRSSAYQEIIDNTESLLRELMGIPENYKVLFLQGGASSQFAMIPLNFMRNTKKADIVLTGAWAKKAYSEGKKYGTMNVVGSSEDKTFSYIPKLDPATFTPDADYFYICQNNTIYGTRFAKLPETGNVPLVADLSSCILSEPVDVSKYAMIFAGAQKNMGPAGLTVAIIREDMLGYCQDITPTMFQYDIHVKNGSMYNTPPTYAIYVCMCVLEWVKAQGGLTAMAERNYEKANLLYNYLDESSLFNPTVMGEDRSIMNVPFVTGNPDLDAAFVKQATAAGLVNLKGHRSVGGMRASIYNAMDLAGVTKLVDFMKDFEKANK